ncbi:MAG: response regulator [Acetobacteraceae bacterium]|nr:response regulator [Acetobacteraceae bacterium]
MTAALEGIRVLVVEDEFLVASLIGDMLTSAGCVVSGPVSRLPEALDAVDRGTFDAAVLDVNLAGDRIDPVADALSRRNVPFLFVTGYGAGILSSQHAARPRLCKPFKLADLLGMLSNVVTPRSPAARITS